MNAHVEFLRISFVKSARNTRQSFLHDKQVDAFIDGIQTPHAEFNHPLVRVVLRINRKVKKYFLVTQYLPSQRIIEEYDNGDIKVEYTITRSHEIEALLLNWLPDVTIITPRILRNHMRHALQRKLDGLLTVSV